MPTFLTAEWRHLLMVNYAVEPDLLRGFLPNGIELDQWNGTTYLSVVGFLFLRTKILGVPIPQHTNFEEVNLRFYVKRLAPDGYRRGVVFIKEIVPRPLIALVARKCYNEPYQTMPMRHAIDEQNGNLQSGSSVEYAWKDERTWNSIRATTVGTPQLAPEGSEEEFITEHYWGYTAQSNGRTKEYRVNHLSWKIWRAANATLSCRIASSYGAAFAGPLSKTPLSAFIAEGSPVKVSTGKLL